MTDRKMKLSPEAKFFDEITRLRTINGHLLAARKDALFALDENEDGSGPSKSQAIERARAAIAKAKRT